MLTKTPRKTRPRCAFCRKAFTPPRRGRRPKYCSNAHRQRAYEERRASARIPSLLLGRDIHDMQTKAGIERAVLDILRKWGYEPPAPKRPPPIRIAVDNEHERDHTPPVIKSKR